MQPTPHCWAQHQAAHKYTQTGRRSSGRGVGRAWRGHDGVGGGRNARSEVRFQEVRGWDWVGV